MANLDPRSRIPRAFLIHLARAFRSRYHTRLQVLRSHTTVEMSANLRLLVAFAGSPDYSEYQRMKIADYTPSNIELFVRKNHTVEHWASLSYITKLDYSRFAL